MVIARVTLLELDLHRVLLLTHFLRLLCLHLLCLWQLCSYSFLLPLLSCKCFSLTSVCFSNLFCCLLQLALFRHWSSRHVCKHLICSTQVASLPCFLLGCSGSLLVFSQPYFSALVKISPWSWLIYLIQFGNNFVFEWLSYWNSVKQQSAARLLVWGIPEFWQMFFDVVFVKYH